MSQRLPVIELRGTPEQVGAQWGEALRESLKNVLEQNLATIGHFHQGPRQEILDLAQKYRPAAEAFDPELPEFLGGQARGSGLGLEEVFFLRCALEMTLYYQGLAGLCTSLALSGPATAGGRTIIGQNADWFAGTPVHLLRIQRHDGLRQLVLSLGIAEYTLTSAGLGLCANLTCTRPQGLHFGVPIFCYLPRVMRQATLAQALGLLCQASRGTGYFHLASAEGAMFGFESVFDEFNVLQPSEGVLVHANHYLTERFQKGDWGHMIFPDTYLRVRRMAELVQGRHGQITPELAMSFLADHQGRPSSICRHPDPALPPDMRSQSLCSFLMLPAEGVLQLCLGNPCQNKFQRYEV
ncbi:MAG: C45 family peptidase [Pseudomonadota bacterium]